MTLREDLQAVQTGKTTRVKNFLRVGEQIPMEHNLQLLDVTHGDKMVYQLFLDTEQSIAYVAWNATVMAVGNISILTPFMEEKKRLLQFHPSATPGQKDAGPIRSTVVSQGSQKE